MKAGFIGTGSIGLSLAMGILNQEKSLLVFDINPEATKSLADKQAQITRSPLEVANGADCVFACLPSIASFDAIVAEPDGILSGERIRLFVNLGGSMPVAQASFATCSRDACQLGRYCVMMGGQREHGTPITIIASGKECPHGRA